MPLLPLVLVLLVLLVVVVVPLLPLLLLVVVLLRFAYGLLLTGGGSLDGSHCTGEPGQGGTPDQAPLRDNEHHRQDV